jgi:xanthine dehydrogenase accessory factor
MDSVTDEADAWARDGRRVALAVVVGTRRSAPRPLGTKMAVSDREDVAGAVSGGCVEGAVVEVARTTMGDGAGRLEHFGYSDEEAWDVGLQCGGEIDVWVEPYDAVTAGWARALRAAQARGAVVTAVRGAALGRKLCVGSDGARTGTLGDPALDALAAGHAERLMWEERSALCEHAGGALFVDVTAPPPRLVAFGAVDYAAALCAMARLLGWRPFVVDPRGFFARPERFPAAEEVIAAWPEEAFARLGGIDRATAVVVLTHDPKLDDAALRHVLRSDAGYIGAMGSRNAQRARRERLLAGGVPEDELARIAAPVGLDLGAVTAEETALSIMGEIVALHRGRTGGRLADATGRIHAGPAQSHSSESRWTPRGPVG